MNSSLKDLYTIPHHVVEQDVYLLDLSEQCAVMEDRVRGIAMTLPPKQREAIEAFLDLRDELEFQSVKAAMRFGKHLK